MAVTGALVMRRAIMDGGVAVVFELMIVCAVQDAHNMLLSASISGKL